jgi:hypothetical protein
VEFEPRTQRPATDCGSIRSRLPDDVLNLDAVGSPRIRSRNAQRRLANHSIEGDISDRPPESDWGALDRVMARSKSRQPSPVAWRSSPASKPTTHRRPPPPSYRRPSPGGVSARPAAHELWLCSFLEVCLTLLVAAWPCTRDNAERRPHLEHAAARSTRRIPARRPHLPCSWGKDRLSAPRRFATRVRV